MVTTHTVYMKPLVPLGGADRAGRKVYFGKYTTEIVDTNAELQLSPTLNVSYIQVVEATNLHNIGVAAVGNTATTGLFKALTTATTGVIVMAIGK